MRWGRLCETISCDVRLSSKGGANGVLNGIVRVLIFVGVLPHEVLPCGPYHKRFSMRALASVHHALGTRALAPAHPPLHPCAPGTLRALSAVGVSV